MNARRKDFIMNISVDQRRRDLGQKRRAASELGKHGQGKKARRGTWPRSALVTASLRLQASMRTKGGKRIKGAGREDKHRVGGKDGDVGGRKYVKGEHDWWDGRVRGEEM